MITRDERDFIVATTFLLFCAVAGWTGLFGVLP
jgi:hypothetical protein